MMKKYLIIACFLLVSNTIFGQNLIRSNVYFNNMYYYNPAQITVEDSLDNSGSVYGKYKVVEQDDEIWDKPMSVMLAYSKRIKTGNSFFSASYINDVYSFFNRNTIYLGFSHQKKLGKSSTFNIGARLVNNFDWINQNKLAPSHHQSRKFLNYNPDLDFGIQYQLRGLNTGLSVKNVFAFSIKMEGSELLKNRRALFFNLSYNFKIVNFLDMAPFILVQHERNNLFDVGLHFSIFKKVNASYALRINELRSVLAFDVKVRRANIGIAYDRSSLLPDNNFDFFVRYGF